jgi:hypothetical protein
MSPMTPGLAVMKMPTTRQKISFQAASFGAGLLG